MADTLNRFQSGEGVGADSAIVLLFSPPIFKPFAGTGDHRTLEIKEEVRKYRISEWAGFQVWKFFHPKG